MENEEIEEMYTGVLNEEDYDNEDFTLNDAFFLGFLAILIVAVFAFIAKITSKHFKNVKLKVGKIEIETESKIEKNE